MLAQIAHLAQTYYYTDSSATSSDTSPVLIIIALAAAAFMFAAMWRVFTKANRPGWAAIIPIYNIYSAARDRKPPSMVDNIVLCSFCGNYYVNFRVLRFSLSFWKERWIRCAAHFVAYYWVPNVGMGRRTLRKASSVGAIT